MRFEATCFGLLLIPEDSMDHQLHNYLEDRPGALLECIHYDGDDYCDWNSLTIEMRLQPPCRVKPEYINGVCVG